MTPDPYMANTGGPGDPAEPSTWNKYAYVVSDPINATDAAGLFYGSDPSGGSIGDEPRPDPTDPGTGPPGWSNCGLCVYAKPRKALRPPLPPPAQAPAALLLAAVEGSTDVVANPGCAGMFLAPGQDTAANRAALSQMLQSAWDQGQIRLLPESAAQASGISPSTAAFTTGTLGYIYVIEGGPFFSGTYNGKSLGGAFEGLSLAQDQELIIIHEFLHYMGIVSPDNANQTYTLPNGQTVTGSAGISQAVKQDCF